MFDNFRRVETSEQVVAQIHRDHDGQLQVWASFSDPTGYNGTPRMMTMWSIAGMDYPLMEVITTWDKLSDGVQVNMQTKCWLLSPIKFEA